MLRPITITLYIPIVLVKISHLTIKTMINKLNTHCFGIDCNVFIPRYYNWHYRYEHERRK